MLSGHRHRFLITEQLTDWEPVGRNTAPAACVSALIAARSGSNALVLLAPSDHVIGDPRAFADAMRIGADAASGPYLGEGDIVRFEDIYRRNSNE